MTSNPDAISSLQGQLSKLSMQPFESLPEDLLLLIFSKLTPFNRALLLSTCQTWNQAITLYSPFWQYLTVPNNLPPSLVIKTLSAFNSRSGYKLKHVIIESLIKRGPELNGILSELRKSAKTLQVLAIRQEDHLNQKTRKVSLKHFTKLDSLITIQSPDFKDYVDYLLYQRSKLGYAEKGVGLRCYATDAFLIEDKEDWTWMKKLGTLRLNQTESIGDCHRILKAPIHLNELDLVDWRQVEPESNTFGVRLNNVTTLILPLDAEATDSLRMSVGIETDGEGMTLVGHLRSFAKFGVRAERIGPGYHVISLAPTSLKRLWINVESDLAFENGDWALGDFSSGMKLINELLHLFKKNRSVEHLQLSSSKSCPNGGMAHMNQILKCLCIARDALESFSLNDYNNPEPAERLVLTSTSDHGLALPALTQLTIRNPILFDQSLLKKVLENGKRQTPEFNFQFVEGLDERVIPEEEWEARGWMI